MRIFLLLIVIATAYYFLYDRGDSKITSQNWAAASPKVKARMMQPPVQQAPKSTQTIPFEEGALAPLASYDITARVLSRKSYSIGKESSISPLDLALGWGEMSILSNISQLSITQGNRFYHYKWDKSGPPIDSNIIATRSANTHIIPANKGIKNTLQSVKPGQIVRLRGLLVKYYEGSPSGRWWAWQSSMTRNDTGAGACELLYVLTCPP